MYGGEKVEGVGWMKCCFTSTETVGLLGTGAQDGHLDFHTALEKRNHTVRRGGGGELSAMVLPKMMSWEDYKRHPAL